MLHLFCYLCFLMGQPAKEGGGGDVERMCPRCNGLSGGGGTSEAENVSSACTNMSEISEKSLV